MSRTSRRSTGADHLPPSPRTAGTGEDRAPARVAAALGGLWLLDGLLQLAPGQFGGALALGIAENAMAQPSDLARALLAFAHRVAPDGDLANLAIAAIQIVLGVLVIGRPTRRVGLAASIPWALAVWVLGEGCGNVFTGLAMVPCGAPGAALLYAGIAAVLLRTDAGASSGGRAGHAARPAARTLARAWFGLWIGGAIAQAVPVSLDALRVRANLDEAASAAPGWLAAIERALAGELGGHGAVATVGLVVAEVLIALAVYAPPRWRHVARAGTLGALLGCWVLGESLGGLLGGAASDVGAMPLCALAFAWATVSARAPEAARARSRSRAAALPEIGSALGARVRSARGAPAEQLAQ